MKEDKRTKILDAAIKLFAVDGFWNTSTASIATEAGVATGTLFNYFASKDVLINDLYAQLKLDTLSIVRDGMPGVEDLRGFLAEAWRRHVQWAVDYPVRNQLLEQLRLSELITSETKTEVAKEFIFFEDLIVKAIAGGQLVDLPVALHFELFKAQISCTLGYLKSVDVSSIDRDGIVDGAFAVYWKGVSP